MRVAVAGSSGRVGAAAVRVLEQDGHDVVQISRSAGVDAYTGDGLADALAGVDAVIDSTNTPVQDREEIVDFFGTITRNLLVAEEKAGVGHHVLLSIVGLDHKTDAPHYVGKREQERQVSAGAVPWSIVRATQFHDFGAMTAGWTEQDGVATVAPLLVQPIAIDDVGRFLAEAAVDTPLNGRVDVAGPQTQDLVDMARRTFAVRGRDVKLVPTWRGLFGTDMSGEVLLPGDAVRLGPTSFEDWLAAGAK
jgi:uncharacterized protein YbjT (DUF2867 family)